MAKKTPCNLIQLQAMHDENNPNMNDILHALDFLGKEAARTEYEEIAEIIKATHTICFNSFYLMQYNDLKKH